MSECPTPDKVPYPSERAARRAVKAIKQNRAEGVGFLRAYRCGGHWHTGHGHKSDAPVIGRRFRT